MSIRTEKSVASSRKKYDVSHEDKFRAPDKNIVFIKTILNVLISIKNKRLPQGNLLLLNLCTNSYLCHIGKTADVNSIISINGIIEKVNRFYKLF